MKRRNPDQWHTWASLAEEGHGSCEDHYPVSAEGEESELLDERYDAYYGRNVIWLGRTGEMFRAYPRYIEAIEGNIFDEDQLAAVVDCIESSPSRVPFIAPVADVVLIDPTTVRESMEYEPDDPWTTGDNELDEWLQDPEEYILSNLGMGLDDEDGTWQEAADALHAEMKERLQDAVDNNEGDLGKFVVQIRDGNHRAFGALASGEPYIYVWLIDWALQDARDGSRPELAEVLE